MKAIKCNLLSIVLLMSISAFSQKIENEKNSHPEEFFKQFIHKHNKNTIKPVAPQYIHKAVKFCLDSIVSLDSIKGLPLWKQTYLYDNYGKPTVEEVHAWNNTKNEWFLCEETKYVYDVKGRIKTVFSTEFYPDNDGNMERSDVKYEYDEFGEYGEYEDKYGNPIRIYLYKLDGTVWKDYAKMEYEWTMKGKIIKGFFYYWRNNAWETDTKYETHYDWNGNQTLETWYGWRDEEWYLSTFTEYRHDGIGNLIMLINYSWFFTEYRKSQIIEYSYDSYRNVVMGFSQVCYNNENNWLPYAQVEYTYDMSCLNDELILPRSSLSVSYTQTHKMIEHKEYYWWGNPNNDGNPEDIRIFSYYYSPRNVDEVDIINLQTENTTINIFPNPVQTHFTVTNTENASLYLYNIVGQEVWHTYSTEENTLINVNFLPQGMYVLKVVKDGVSSTHKMVKN